MARSISQKPVPKKSVRKKSVVGKKPVGLDFSRAFSVIRKLYTQHPDADTELDYENPYQLLAATILSAQSTDAGVNLVT